ncbi:patatin-like phospholipase family protein [Halostella sp. JP-L12]|uniref:patatin-like phospholipase family protein n=1 Tax=Halostella TaxID=1843185 RepID=UPI000EF83F48|nr:MULTISPECIES: patatin-like phospholipase family protein [Halostella]NHN47840.1 patatin-like phospholipase family protein [Halostella sp. JP-L12]
MSERDADAAGESDPDNVAIACQGGGSHTAFTAGVLRGLLREWDRDRHRLVGISGTSGGAFNALAAWYGLVVDDEERAAELVTSLWADMVADDALDRLANEWVVGSARAQHAGFPVFQVSPYFTAGSRRGQEQIRRILERHIDFDAVPDLCGRDVPDLVVGTVDVHAGEFDTFVNEEVTADAVLASAAIPTLFPGVHLRGSLHWDGLFSQNPPVQDLMTGTTGVKPDELWVVQINPQSVDERPRTLAEIADRRNQLSGNLSLNQELRFVEQVNEWIEAGWLPESEFTHTEIRRIPLGRQYDLATKLDRRPSFVESLVELGEERAEAFLADLER